MASEKGNLTESSGDDPTKDPRRQRLADMIAVVDRAAAAKGWAADVTAEDTRDYRYATIAVFRTAPGTDREITGTFELTCDKEVKITYHVTSFHSHGMADLYDAVSNEFWKLPWIKKKRPEGVAPALDAAIAIVEPLLRRFHKVVRQLKHRHDDRAAFLVSDEYDVQDVLHAILRGFFDDVRPEEYSPSYAGGASRLDFLLKAEKLVIETKFASATLRDKQIGEQLIVDIKRYQKHPDCKRLICFVYDPGGHVKNPGGLEADLSGIHDGLEVKVIVVSL